MSSTPAGGCVWVDVCAAVGVLKWEKERESENERERAVVSVSAFVFVLHIDNFINAVTFSIKYAQRRKHSCTGDTHTHEHPYTQLPHPHMTPRPCSPCHGPSIVGKSIDMCRCAAFGRLQIANQSINNWNENHFAGFNLSSPATAADSPPFTLRLCCCVTLRFGCVCKWAKLCTSITRIGSESASRAADTHTQAARLAERRKGSVPGWVVSALPGVRD